MNCAASPGDFIHFYKCFSFRKVSSMVYALYTWTLNAKPNSKCFGWQKNERTKWRKQKIAEWIHTKTTIAFQRKNKEKKLSKSIAHLNSNNVTIYKYF